MPARRRADSRLLLAWVLLVAVVADLALVLVTADVPVDRLIALPIDVPGVSDDPMRATLAGVAFWTLIALLGSLRVVPAAGHGVLTFHLPFIVAAVALGGPVAGGWVAMLGTFERRELAIPRSNLLDRILTGSGERTEASMPWYGVLHNHTAFTLAAVLAGLASLGVRDALAAAAAGPPGSIADPAFTFALSYAAAAAVFAVVSVSLVSVAVVLRDGLSGREAVQVQLDSYRDTLVGEAVMGWLLAWVYLTVGIWAPIVAFALLLTLWSKTRAAADADVDQLTGIASRASVMRRLRAALREARQTGGSVGVLYIDIRGLKALNDGPAGHAGGDILLGTIGSRLASVIRLMDTAGRLGGDEFLVLLRDIADERQLLDAAHRIRAALARPIAALAPYAATGIYGPEASIGCLLADPSVLGLDLDAGLLVAAADRAMYASRHPGADGIRLATESDITEAFGSRVRTVRILQDSLAGLGRAT